jgi:hypothetical protein
MTTRSLRLPAAVFIALVWLPSAAAAQALATDESAGPAVSAGTSLMFTSAYVWRGFQPTEGPAIQPSLWVTCGDMTVTSWMNVIASGGPGALNEHDLTIDYTRATGLWKFSVGYTNYFFPTASEGRFSDEFYGAATWSGPLHPVVRVSTDVGEGSGTYVSVGVSHTVTLGRLAATPSATLGYNHGQWVDGSGLSDLLLGVQVALPPIARRLSIAPFVSYSKSLRDEWFPSRAFAGATITIQ